MLSIAMLDSRELAIAAAIVAALCFRFIDGQLFSAVLECVNSLW